MCEYTVDGLNTNRPFKIIAWFASEMYTQYNSLLALSLLHCLEISLHTWEITPPAKSGLTLPHTVTVYQFAHQTMLLLGMYKTCRVTGSCFSGLPFWVTSVDPCGPDPYSCSLGGLAFHTIYALQGYRIRYLAVLTVVRFAIPYFLQAKLISTGKGYNVQNTSLPAWAFLVWMPFVMYSEVTSILM